MQNDEPEFLSYLIQHLQLLAHNLRLLLLLAFAHHLDLLINLIEVDGVRP